MRQPSAACSPEGAIPAGIPSVSEEGVLTMAEGVKLRLANIVWPDHLEPNQRKRLAAGLTESLKGQRISWKAVQPPDRWGITPAFLFVQEPEAAGAVALPPFWLQAGMIEAGLVPAWPDHLAGRCWADLLRHEALAIQRRRGHWAPRVQAERLRRIAAEPAAHAGRRMVTSWQIRSARKWRDLLFLNFGEGRNAPAISLAPKLISELTRMGAPPDSWAGRRAIIRFTVSGDGLRRSRLESTDHITINTESAKSSQR